jgi:hypothetical protein
VSPPSLNESCLQKTMKLLTRGMLC